MQYLQHLQPVDGRSRFIQVPLCVSLRESELVWIPLTRKLDLVRDASGIPDIPESSLTSTTTANGEFTILYWPACITARSLASTHAQQGDQVAPFTSSFYNNPTSEFAVKFTCVPFSMGANAPFSSHEALLKPFHAGKFLSESELASVTRRWDEDTVKWTMKNYVDARKIVQKILIKCTLFPMPMPISSTSSATSSTTTGKKIGKVRLGAELARPRDLLLLKSSQIMHLDQISTPPTTTTTTTLHPSQITFTGKTYSQNLSAPLIAIPSTNLRIHPWVLIDANASVNLPLIASRFYLQWPCVTSQTMTKVIMGQEEPSAAADRGDEDLIMEYYSLRGESPLLEQKPADRVIDLTSDETQSKSQSQSADRITSTQTTKITHPLVDSGQSRTRRVKDVLTEQAEREQERKDLPVAEPRRVDSNKNMTNSSAERLKPPGDRAVDSTFKAVDASAERGVDLTPKTADEYPLRPEDSFTAKSGPEVDHKAPDYRKRASTTDKNQIKKPKPNEPARGPTSKYFECSQTDCLVVCETIQGLIYHYSVLHSWTESLVGTIITLVDGKTVYKVGGKILAIQIDVARDENVFHYDFDVQDDDLASLSSSSSSLSGNQFTAGAPIERRRRKFAPEISRILEDHFAIDSHPKMDVRRSLVSKTGLEINQICMYSSIPPFAIPYVVFTHSLSHVVSQPTS